MFGEQLQDTKAQPAVPTWSEVVLGDQRHAREDDDRDDDPQAAADEMQQNAESIGTRMT